MTLRIIESSKTPIYDKNDNYDSNDNVKEDCQPQQ